LTRREGWWDVHGEKTLRPERPFFRRKKGGRGERNKKLFHVISEEIFKFVRPQGSRGDMGGGGGS